MGMNLDGQTPQIAEHEAGGKPHISKEMEDEIYGLLGALLGMLEVLSIDTADPLAPRQRRFIADALRFGDMLRTRVEALVTLLADEHDPRFVPSEYPLRRLIDHAVRGATWSAADKGVSIVLPPADELEPVAVGIDVARVDRALRAITDTLVAALPEQSQLLVRVRLEERSVGVELAGVAAGPEKPSVLQLSNVLFAAWQRIFVLQGGSLQVDREQLSVRVELPRREPH
jgi:signal transduction histidine kinase